MNIEGEEQVRFVTGDTNGILDQNSVGENIDGWK